MKKIYKLVNQIKNYEWGSPSFIPQFLNINNSEKKPYAEMWMGTHRGAPSKAEDNGSLVSLENIAGELPFLFKLIAVEKTLSIQVHPDKSQAAEGFERENKAGISLDDPVRCYKDANMKNEIICAITPFTLMAGFKDTGDFDVCSPLCYNSVTLAQGQAIFIPCGIPHSYKSGFGIELMNNSDNVIRGGLTNKHVDLNEFKKIVKTNRFTPDIITPDSNSQFNYSIPCGDFSLSLIRGSKGALNIRQGEPAIGIVTEGELQIDNMCFRKGESFFISGDNSQLRLDGVFSLFIASKSFALNKPE